MSIPSACNAPATSPTLNDVSKDRATKDHSRATVAKSILCNSLSPFPHHYHIDPLAHNYHAIALKHPNKQATTILTRAAEVTTINRNQYEYKKYSTSITSGRKTSSPYVV